MFKTERNHFRHNRLNLGLCHPEGRNDLKDNYLTGKITVLYLFFTNIATCVSLLFNSIQSSLNKSMIYNWLSFIFLNLHLV